MYIKYFNQQTKRAYKTNQIKRVLKSYCIKIGKLLGLLAVIFVTYVALLAIAV